MSSSCHSGKSSGRFRATLLWSAVASEARHRFSSRGQAQRGPDRRAADAASLRSLSDANKAVSRFACHRTPDSAAPAKNFAPSPPAPRSPRFRSPKSFWHPHSGHRNSRWGGCGCGAILQTAPCPCPLFPREFEKCNAGFNHREHRGHRVYIYRSISVLSVFSVVKIDPFNEFIWWVNGMIILGMQGMLEKILLEFELGLHNLVFLFFSFRLRTPPVIQTINPPKQMPTATAPRESHTSK